MICTEKITMKKSLFLLLIFSFCFASFSFPETIVLKSGRVVVGELIEKTDEYIKIDYKGVILTYYKDEINPAPIDVGPIPSDEGVIRIIKKKEKKTGLAYDDACLASLKSRTISEYQKCQCRIFPELEDIQDQYDINVEPMALENGGSEFQECAAYLSWSDKSEFENEDDCKKKKREISNSIRSKNLPFFIIRSGLSCE